MTGTPRTVRTAVLLMTLVGAGYVIDAVALAAGAFGYRDRVTAAAVEHGVNPQAVDIAGGLAVLLPYLAAAITAAAGVVMLTLAASVRAGHFAGRIIAWVAAGLALLCSSCASAVGGTPAFSGTGHATFRSTDTTGTHIFQQRLPEGYPLSYQYLSGVIAGLAVIALILVVILLALPSANQYFRPIPQPIRPPAGWQPPAQTAPPSGHVQQMQERAAQLADLQRKRERGEVTDEQFAQEWRRLTGGS